MGKNNDITIYFDMDGVLADFRGYLEKHNICYVPHDTKDKEADARMWDWIKNVERFYYQLEPVPGILELFNELNEEYHCEILTAIPKPHWGMVGAAEDKKAWIAKYLGEEIPVNIVYREQKKDFVKNKDCILIDDLPQNISEWNEYGGTGILFESAEKFDKSLIPGDSSKQLRDLCIRRAKEIYGGILPDCIEVRLNEELERIEKAGGYLSETFLTLARRFRTSCSEENDRYTRGFRGALGTSLVAYLCNITPFNPMDLPESLTMHMFSFFDKKHLPLYINVSKKAEKKLREGDGCYELPKGVELYSTPNLELLEKLRSRTKDIYICNGYDNGDDGFDADMWEVLRSDDIKFLPEFRDNPLAKSIIDCVTFLNTAALTKVIGLMHGSRTWLDNAEYLVEKYDDWLEKANSCEEDVYEYLVARHMPYTRALAITEKVRHGNKSLSEDDVNFLRAYHCEEWFIESVGKTQFLFSRAQTLCYAMETKQLIYYLKKYRRIYIHIFEQVYGIKASRWADLKGVENTNMICGRDIL